MLNKKILVPVATIVLLAGAGVGTKTVLAQNSHFESSLVQKIADTFHLNKNDVQKVFDQNVQDRKAQMEKKFEDRLDQAVKDGTLTAAQKQLILDKRKELETNLANLKDMKPADRKAAMQKQRDDLKNWAKQNNIDLKYLMPGFGMGVKLGHWK